MIFITLWSIVNELNYQWFGRLLVPSYKRKAIIGHLSRLK